MLSTLSTVSFFQRHHGGAGNFPEAPEEAEEEVEDEGEIVLPEHPHVPAAAHAEEGNHGVSGQGQEQQDRATLPEGTAGTAAMGHKLPLLTGSPWFLFLT